jgi:hypothetical protein
MHLQSFYAVKGGDKLKRKIQTVTIMLLIAMLLAIFLPTTTTSASAYPTETAIPKTEDVFNGSFSPQEVVATPGEPFDVIFSLCPTMDTPNTVISFVLPADLVKLVSGNKVTTRDLSKGGALTLELSLETKGEVDVYLKADVEASPSGKNYQSSYYLHVTTSNAGFDPIKGGSVSAVNMAYVSTTSNPESSRATENSVEPAAATFRIYGKFYYLNELGSYSPARYMLVEIWDSDDVGDDLLASAYTNANGEYDITAPNDDGVWPFTSGADPYVKFVAVGEWDWLSTNAGGDTYSWSTGVLQDDVPDGWVKNVGTLAPTSAHEAIQAGDAVYQEAQWIYDRTSWQRGRVTIRWPKGDWPCSWGDAIDLPLKSVWGWNHATVQHEEGHCVMWALYGHWPPGTGPDPHYVYSESSNGFAMAEGWAEFMQCAVDNKATNLQGWYGGHGGNIETNDWYNCIDTGTLDGAVVEGSVASIFWDINDPVNIAGDNDHMGWGFDEIFTVIRYDQPDSILEFWNDWKARWPTVSTSVGPLCDIYWNYGIDEDYLPWGQPWGGTISINGGATYTLSKTVTLTLFCDDWGSGVRHMRFSEDMGSTWGSWVNYATTYTYTIKKATDGFLWIDVQFADYWGQTTTSGTIYDGIIVDTLNPTGSITINSGATYTTTTSVTLSLTYSDATSGVDKVRYGNLGGSWSAWEAPSATKTWTLSSGDGAKYVYYQIMDKAGLISTQFYDYIILDTVAPTGSITINSGNPTTPTRSVTLSLTYSDATSGVDKVRYSNSGTWGAWENPSPTKAWTLTAGDGTKTVYYQIRDKAGRLSPTYSDTIILQTPTASIHIWSDKTAYHIGDTMKVHIQVKNPGSALPVRIVIALKLTDGSYYMMLDMKTTLPASFDSGDVLYESFKLPSIPLGTYVWTAALLNPTTNAVISLSTWSWQVSAGTSIETPSVILQAKDQ